MYGRGASSLAQKTIKCTIKEAEKYLNNWWARYPGFRTWWKKVRDEAVNEGEVVSMFGRKRRFHVIRQETAYHSLNEAVNFPIQSLSTDCSLTSLIELHEQLKPYDSYVLTTVHDSIIFEVNKSYLGTAMHIIQNSMSKPKLPDMPGLPIDFKIGVESWGAAKEYDIHTCQKCGTTEDVEFCACMADGEFKLCVLCMDHWRDKEQCFISPEDTERFKWYQKKEKAV